MNRKVIILIVIIFIVSACSSNGVIDSVQKEITNEFGTEIFFPEYEEYPITSVEIVHLPSGDKKDVIVTYSKEKGELLDDHVIEEIENERNSKFLHGLNDGKPWMLKITYSNFEMYNTNRMLSKTEINDIAIWYDSSTVNKRGYIF